METELLPADHRIISRNTNQPPRLPGDPRHRIEAGWGGAPVQLYALADLAPALRLSETWVALGATHVTLARLVAGGRREEGGGGDGSWHLQSFERTRIGGGGEAPGLSATTLTAIGVPE